jgi:hypothetical protein
MLHLVFLLLHLFSLYYAFQSDGYRAFTFSVSMSLLEMDYVVFNPRGVLHILFHCDDDISIPLCCFFMLTSSCYV